MKVGIRFSDNDFQSSINWFFKLFILPTFIEREEGHFVTHLTSPMIVELFKLHLPYVNALQTYETRRWNTASFEELVQRLKGYFHITEMNVYWDGNADDYLELDENGQWTGSGGEFTWTDGKAVY